MRKYYPSLILIDPSAFGKKYTQRIVRRVSSSIPVKRLKTSGETVPDEGELLLTEEKGDFIKPCPATPRYICCDYYILDFSSNCGMECTYCALQDYFDEKGLTFYVNAEGFEEELDNLLTENPDKHFRIGTGEFTDSLLLEHLTDFHQKIIPVFKQKNRAVLEIKTKTDGIDDLLHIKPKDSVITAWSVNPSKLISGEEFRVATLEERLKAAQRCVKAGYKTAFHFDPLIYYIGWKKGYKEIVKRLFDAVDPADIVYISMGTFRFVPSLKPVIQKRFPETKIIYEEFIKAQDGKMRYPKPLRIKMYRKMHEWIRNHAPEVCIYLCMEREDVWEEVFGFTPKEKGGVEEMLIEACF